MAKKYKSGSIDFNDVPTLGDEEIIQRTEGMQLAPTVEKPKPLKLQTEETMGLAGTLNISLGEAEEMQQFISADDNSRFLQRVKSFLGPFPVPEAPRLRYTAGQIRDYFKYGLYKRDVPTALKALPGELAAGFMTMGKLPSQMRQMMAELLPEKPTQPIYPMGIEEETREELSEKAKATNAKIDAFVNAAFPLDETIDWNMTPLAKLTQISARGGLPSMAVAMGASIITKNPWPGLLVLGTVETGGAYERQRIYGETPSKAALKAFASGGIEIATEKLPFDFLLRGQVVMSMAGEALQEKLAGLGQNYIDEYTRLTVQEGMESVEASKQAVAYARKQSDEDALVGATMGLLGAGAVKTGRALTKKTEKPAKPGEAAPVEPTPVEPTPAVEKPDFTTMGWKDLQQAARDYGVNAFQKRGTLIDVITKKMEQDAIPAAERYGAMSWKELQGEARKQGVNAFQKRSVVIEELLKREELAPEEPAPTEAGIFRTDKTDVPLYDQWMEKPDYAREAKGKALRVTMMTPDEYLERSSRLQGITAEETARMITEESKSRIREAVKKGEKLYMPYLDYTTKNQEGRNRAAVAREMGQEQIPVLIIEEAEEAAAVIPAELTVRRTLGELETQIGILNELIKDLGGLVKQFPDDPSYQKALEKAQQKKEQVNIEVVEGMLEEASSPLEAATNVTTRLAMLHEQLNVLREQLAQDPDNVSLENWIGQIEDEIADIEMMEKTLKREEAAPPAAERWAEFERNAQELLAEGEDRGLIEKIVEEIEDTGGELSIDTIAEMRALWGDTITDALLPLITGPTEEMGVLTGDMFGMVWEEMVEQVKKKEAAPPTAITLEDEEEEWTSDAGELMLGETLGAGWDFYLDYLDSIGKDVSNITPREQLSALRTMIAALPSEIIQLEEGTERKEQLEEILAEAKQFERVWKEIHDRHKSKAAIPPAEPTEEVASWAAGYTRGELESMVGKFDEQIDEIISMMAEEGEAKHEQALNLASKAKGRVEDEIVRREWEEATKTPEGRAALDEHIEELDKELDSLNALIEHDKENLELKFKRIDVLEKLARLNKIRGEGGGPSAVVPEGRPGTYTEVNPEIQAAAEEIPPYVKDVLSEEDYNKLISLLKAGIYGPLRDFDLELEGRLDASDHNVKRLLESINTILFNSLSWGETAKELEEMGRKDIADQLFEETLEAVNEPRNAKIAELVDLLLTEWHDAVVDILEETGLTEEEFKADFLQNPEDALATFYDLREDLEEALRENRITTKTPAFWAKALAELDQRLREIEDLGKGEGPPTYKGPGGRPGFVLMPWAAMEGTANDIRQTILSIMKKLGITKYKLAQLVQGDMSQRTVYSFLTGEKDITLERADILLQALGIVPEEEGTVKEHLMEGINALGLSTYQLAKLVEEKMSQRHVYGFLSGTSDITTGKAKILAEALDKAPYRPGRGPYRYKGFVLMPWALMEGKGNDFIAAIKSRMKKLDMSGSQLLRLLGGEINPRSFYNYMGGRVEPPSERLAKMLDALGLGIPGGTDFLAIITDRLKEIGYTKYDLSVLVKGKIPIATVYTFLSGAKDTKMGNIRIMLDALEKPGPHKHRPLGRVKPSGKFRLEPAPRTYGGPAGFKERGVRGRPGFAAIPGKGKKGEGKPSGKPPAAAPVGEKFNEETWTRNVIELLRGKTPEEGWLHFYGFLDSIDQNIQTIEAYDLRRALDAMLRSAEEDMRTAGSEKERNNLARIREEGRKLREQYQTREQPPKKPPEKPPAPPAAAPIEPSPGDRARILTEIDVAFKAGDIEKLQEMLDRYSNQPGMEDIATQLAHIISGMGPKETVAMRRKAEPAPEGRLAPPVQAELDEANKALSAQLTKVEKIRKKEVEPAIKKMRKQQIAKAMAIEEQVAEEGASAADVIRRSKGGYKVEVDIPTMTPLELSVTQWDAYSRQVYSVYPGPEFKFQQTTAQDALDKLRTGHILTDSELALLIPVMGIDVVEDLQRVMEKMGDRSQRSWNILRDIILFWKSPFNYDLQFVRNAVNFLPRHPIKYTKGVMQSLASYANRNYAQNLIDAVKEDPEYEDASSYLNFLETGALVPIRLLPEQYRGRLPTRLAKIGAKRGPFVWAAAMPIRGIGRMQLAAERSFVASANWFMMELWKQRSAQWEPSLQLLETGELTLEERKRVEDTVEKHKKNYGDVVNTYMKILRAKSATGRAIQTAANFVLWSPSMTYSRFKRPKLYLTNSGSRGYAMQLEAATIAKTYLVMMAAVAIGNYFRDDDDQIETEMDPRSSNWGKFKVSDTWFDLGGGETQHYRTLAQFIVGEVKTQSGRTVEIPRWDIAKKYAQGRETALIGVLQELLTGETVFGQKVWEAPDIESLEAEGTVTADIYAEAWRKSSGLPAGETAFLTGRFLSEHLMPAALVSFAEAAVMDGWPQAVAAGITEAMALSAQSYKQRANAELNLLQDALAQTVYKKKWEDLKESEQKNIKRMEPILAEKQVEVRKEQQQWATQPFERREEKEIEEKLFNALTKPVQRELEKLGLTAGSVSRRWGSVAAPFYLNDVRFERYVELTKAHTGSALDRLFGRASYRKLLLPEKEAAVRMALAEAKSAARMELEKLINTNAI